MAKKNSIVIELFYKYVLIENPEEFQKKHLAFCKRLGIKGKVLVAKEGINGSVSGTRMQVEKYKKELTSDQRFKNITFKEQLWNKHPFDRMFVRIRKEIVTSGFDVEIKEGKISNKGVHISPEKFKEWLDNKEDIIIFDARNDYETRIGKFKNAICPDIETFSELPDVIPKLAEHKHKKIVMYCTGGVRCEKASALFKKKGFKKVYQLKGGIINYGSKFPDDTHWEGLCFVFDKRLSTPIGKTPLFTNKNAITTCAWCGIECGNYTNCRNIQCDAMFISCNKCKSDYYNACSGNCKKKIENNGVESEVRNRVRSKRDENQ